MPPIIACFAAGESRHCIEDSANSNSATLSVSSTSSDVCRAPAAAHFPDVQLSVMPRNGSHSSRESTPARAEICDDRAETRERSPKRSKENRVMTTRTGSWGPAVHRQRNRSESILPLTDVNGGGPSQFLENPQSTVVWLHSMMTTKP